MTQTRPYGLRRRTTVTTVLAAALITTGCGSTGTTTPPAAPAAVSSPAAAAAPLTVRDPWVKAGKAGEMTAAFGVLVNPGTTDVTVLGAQSPVSPLELHEMAMDAGAMVMRPKQGGFVVEAGGTHELGPGGDHLMLMKPSADIEAGDEVSFTLTLAGGATVPFTAVAKPFAGAGESYAPDMPMPASGMPMTPPSSPAS